MIYNACAVSVFNCAKFGTFSAFLYDWSFFAALFMGPFLEKKTRFLSEVFVNISVIPLAQKIAIWNDTLRFSVCPRGFNASFEPVNRIIVNFNFNFSAGKVLQKW